MINMKFQSLFITLLLAMTSCGGKSKALGEGEREGETEAEAKGEREGKADAEAEA